MVSSTRARLGTAACPRPTRGTTAISYTSAMSHVERKEADAMTETMKHAGAEMSRLASRDRLTVATTMRGLFRVEVHPCRRYRRLAKDYERKVQTSETLIQLAAIRLLLRRLAGHIPSGAGGQL